MGFGILLFGYVIGQVMSLTFYAWAFRLVGYALIAFAATRICEYFSHFRFVYASAGLILLSAAFDALYAIWGMAAGEAIPGWLESAELFNQWAALFLTLLFHFTLLRSIRLAAEEVGLSDLRVTAMTDLIWVAVGVILYFLANSGLIDVRIPWLMQLVWSVIVAVLIFNCYRLICPAGDEDMPRRESKFAFVNKFSDALEKREAEAVRRTNEEIAERRAKLEEKKSAPNRNSNRKKKK